MGRAMLIICSGVLISVGFMSMSTSEQGKMLTEKNVNYAEFTMAKNTAHTAIQIAMQDLNSYDSDDHSYLTKYSKSDPYKGTIDGRSYEIYLEELNNVTANAYWSDDSIRFVSRATQSVIRGGSNEEVEAEVVTVFIKSRFSALVPQFEGALTFAADPDKFTFSAGGSASINGNSPNSCSDGQDETKPAITVQPGAEENLDDLNNIDVDADPAVGVDSSLSYQPTDQLIARLANTDGVKYLSGNVSEPLGTAAEPGVFFVEDYLKLNGKQKEGYGILVVRSDAEIEYNGVDEEGASLTVNGNFEWNGLIIFEDAYNFSGRGTPKINGSILVGHTEDYNGEPIAIDINGNIQFQYDCKGEDYARMAAANAVKQNKYTKVVTSEGTRWN